MASLDMVQVLPRVMASQALRASHYCNQSAFTCSTAFPTFYSIVSGDQNSLSGSKAEQWLRLPTIDQCGHNPIIIIELILLYYYASLLN